MTCVHERMVCKNNGYGITRERETKGNWDRVLGVKRELLMLNLLNDNSHLNRDACSSVL